MNTMIEGDGFISLSLDLEFEFTINNESIKRW